ncbi:MAG: hypothetical protein H3C28_09790 [Sphingomonadales bacterium]|nr:hypothetical protein [Sphingomonadales bacterium]
MGKNAKHVVATFIASVDAALRGRSANPYKLLCDNVVVVVIGTTPLSGVYFGQDEVRKILAPTAALRIKSGEVTILDSIAEGDRVGVFLKITATSRVGNIYNAAGDPAGCYFKLKGDKISEIRFYPDTTQIETQLYGHAFVPNSPRAPQPAEARP